MQPLGMLQPAELRYLPQARHPGNRMPFELVQVLVSARPQNPPCVAEDSPPLLCHYRGNTVAICYQGQYQYYAAGQQEIVLYCCVEQVRHVRAERSRGQGGTKDRAGRVKADAADDGPAGIVHRRERVENAVVDRGILEDKQYA